MGVRRIHSKKKDEKKEKIRLTQEGESFPNRSEKSKKKSGRKKLNDPSQIQLERKSRSRGIKLRK